MKISTWDDEIASILADPANFPMPSEIYIRLHIALRIIEVMNHGNMEAFVTFILRDGFSPEYRLLVMMQATKRDPSLADADAFKRWAMNDALLK